MVFYKVISNRFPSPSYNLKFFTDLLTLHELTFMIWFSFVYMSIFCFSISWCDLTTLSDFNLSCVKHRVLVVDGEV
jgi:hypothetical protein